MTETEIYELLIEIKKTRPKDVLDKFNNASLQELYQKGFIKKRKADINTSSQTFVRHTEILITQYGEQFLRRLSKDVR